MKKNNKLVPYEEKKLIPVKKLKIDIKKLILPIIIILVIAVLVIFISYLLNPSNKAKRYLEDNGYVCNMK